MKELLVISGEIGKRYMVIVLLLLLVVTEAFSLVFVEPSREVNMSQNALEQASALKEPVLRISEITGPQIDFGAALVAVADDNSIPSAALSSCRTLPTYLWIYLLLAYVALLVYNFSSTFKKATTPQWFWEKLYTALALLAWYVFDGCRAYPWFPLTILKAGVILFVAYVYLLEKKKKNEPLEVHTQ